MLLNDNSENDDNVFEETGIAEKSEINDEKRTLVCYKCGGSMKRFENGWAICFDCGRRIKYKKIYKQFPSVKQEVTINQTVHLKAKKEDPRVEANKSFWNGFWSFLKSDNGLIIIILLGLTLVIAALSYSLHKDAREEAKRIQSEIKSGKITAGNYENYDDEDYKAVKKQLEALGFTNIELIDLDDSGVLFWNNGDVEAISIDGKYNFTSKDYFYPDAKVIIEYH